MRRPGMAVLLFVATLALALPSSVGAASLTLEWDPPSDSTTTGYIVLYGTTSGVYTSQRNAGFATTFRVDGLADGTRYCFAVQAYNSAGQVSEPSSEVCGTTAAAPPPPPPPPSDSGTGSSGGSGGGSTGGSTGPTGSTGGTTSGGSTSGGTTSGGTTSGGATSGGTAAPATSTSTSSTSIGARPWNVSASLSGQTVDVSWAPPTAASPSAYRVEIGTSPGTTAMSGLTAGLAASFRITDLPSAGYFIRVRAVVDGVTGEPSDEIMLTVGGAAPPPRSAAIATACSAAPGAPVAFAATAQGSAVQLSWQPGAGDAPTAYVLQVGSAPGRADLLTVPIAGHATGLQATAGVGTYALRLIALNACGVSGFAPEALLVVGGAALAAAGAAAPPAAPASLSQQVDGSTVTLRWSPPASGAPVTRYLIEATSAAGTFSFDTGNPATSFTSPDTPSGTYTVRVRAGNAAGWGPASAGVTIIVP